MIPAMSEPGEFAVLAQGAFKEMRDLALVLEQSEVEARVVEPPPEFASP
jgi:hypothetical protein